MRHRARLARAGLVLGIATGSLAFASTASAQLDEINTKKLRDAVTVNGILPHERVFQTIANQNGGTRASGTPGYRRVGRLRQAAGSENAGYEVGEQQFTFPFFRDLARPTLSQVSPTPTDYETATFHYSGSGDVTGAWSSRRTTSCYRRRRPARPPAASRDRLPGRARVRPAVALIQRGTLQLRGQGRERPGRRLRRGDHLQRGPGGPHRAGHRHARPPVHDPGRRASASPTAHALVSATAAGDVVVRVSTSTETDLEATTCNVIADTPEGQPERERRRRRAPRLGRRGPGHQRQRQRHVGDPRDRRGDGRAERHAAPRSSGSPSGAPRSPACWAPSTTSRTSARASSATISANLNFDMVGSPNYVRFVYDGDGSDTPRRRTARIGADREVVHRLLRVAGPAERPDGVRRPLRLRAVHRGRHPRRWPVHGRRGHQDRRAGAVYGGTAGVAYDPCYHQACDTINNLSTTALNEMADAAAHASLTLARSRCGFFEDGSRVRRPEGRALEGVRRARRRCASRYLTGSRIPATTSIVAGSSTAVTSRPTRRPSATSRASTSRTSSGASPPGTGNWAFITDGSRTSTSRCTNTGPSSGTPSPTPSALDLDPLGGIEVAHAARTTRRSDRPCPASRRPSARRPRPGTCRRGSRSASNRAC